MNTNDVRANYKPYNANPELMLLMAINSMAAGVVRAELGTSMMPIRNCRRAGGASHQWPKHNQREANMRKARTGAEIVSVKNIGSVNLRRMSAQYFQVTDSNNVIDFYRRVEMGGVVSWQQSSFHEVSEDSVDAKILKESQKSLYRY